MIVLTLAQWLCLLIAVAAFVDAVSRPAAAWRYAGVRRDLWLGLTGVAALVCLVGLAPLGLLGLVGVVVALVYLLEHRPKLQGYPGPRRWPWR